MTRRRKSKVGIPKPIKMSPRDIKREKLNGQAFFSVLGDPIFSFNTSYLGKADCCVFKAKFAAKVFLNMMLADDEFDWVEDSELVTFNGLKIKGPQLRKIYDYQLKKVEREFFELGDEYRKRCLLMRDDSPHAGFDGPDPNARQKRHSRKGMFKMDTVAAELGITPRACRSALRQKEIEKPAHGWAWRTRKEVEKIKQLITGKNTIRIDLSKAVQPS